MSGPDDRFVIFARTRDAALREELVLAHRGIAEVIARRYARRGPALADLQQVAYLALVNAVDRFDPALGVRFATFAGRTIEGELKRYFRDRTWAMRVPRSQQDRAVAVRRVVDDLTVRLGRSPRVPEVAAALDVSEDDVLEALDASAAHSVDSLDRPVLATDGAATVAEGVGRPEPGLDRVEDQVTVAGLLAHLPARERTIVELRFYGGLSQREIAERVGISQMHVSRLLRRSFEHLRRLMMERDPG